MELHTIIGLSLVIIGLAGLFKYRKHLGSIWNAE
jgi:hypothetical protein